MSDDSSTMEVVGRRVSYMRTSMIVTSVVGIVLGLIMLFWPGVTLLVVAGLFGIALIVAGVSRIVFGISVSVGAGFRWLMAILGVLMVVAGALCLARPLSTLVFIAIVIGIGWIFEGAHDILAGITGRTIGPRWLALLGGVVGVIAGIVVLALPALALGTFAVVGGILLIMVSIVTLFALPKKGQAG